MSNWKETERFIAAVLGGRRVPITGRQRGDVPDIAHDRYSIEVKRRSSPTAFPKWLTTAIEQADAANPGGKTPIVVIEHAHGRGVQKDHYVLLRLFDFVDLTAPSMPPIPRDMDDLIYLSDNPVRIG